MLKVVFDTNVYISALLFDGPPRQVLELAKRDKVILIISKPIIDETTRILKEKFKWPDHRINQFKRQISKTTKLCNPKKRLSVLSDEPDNRIIECAVESDADLIISGDNHLLKLKQYMNVPIQKTKYLTYLISKE